MFSLIVVIYIRLYFRFIGKWSMFAEGNWAKKCSSVLFTYFFFENFEQFLFSLFLS